MQSGFKEKDRQDFQILIFSIWKMWVPILAFAKTEHPLGADVGGPGVVLPLAWRI